MAEIIIATLFSSFLSVMVNAKFKKRITKIDNKPTEKKHNFMKLFFSMLPILFIISFRWNAAPDTMYPNDSYYSYYYIYRLCQLTDGHYYPSNMEPITFLIFNVASRFEIPFFFLLLIFSVIYYVSFVWFLSRNCEVWWFGIILFSLLGLTVFPFGAIRQAFGETFILIAYDIIIHSFGNDMHGKIKSLVIAIIILFIGGFVHTTCWAMIPIIIISSHKFSLRNLVIGSVILASSSVFLGKYLVKLLVLSNHGYVTRLSGEFKITYTLLVIFVLLTLALNIKQLYKENYNLINILFMYLVVCFWSPFTVDEYRILHMFSPVIIIMTTRLYKSFSYKQNKLTIVFLYLIVCGTLFYLNTNTFEYESVFENTSNMFIK